MLIIDLQQKVLSLQSKLSVSTDSSKYELYDKLTKFYKQLDYYHQESKAKDWQILATATWETTVNKLL